MVLANLTRAILVVALVVSVVTACRRVPHRDIDADRIKSPGDNGFRLAISGDPTEYVAGKAYNLFLLGSPTNDFNRFMINAQSSSTADRTTTRLSFTSPKRVGRFQLFSDAISKFSEDCVNTIVESHDAAKSEIQVMWVAPKTGSGCVSIAAMVYVNTGKWYADDGALSKIICEASPESQHAKKVQSAECCACDEAKYSFIFEGIWSNQTHPRDYPFAIWLTHFSDVIGASHESNFSFWGENHIATDGFRSLAEWGSVRLLETELRAKGSRLRTLIKAAGLWYPYVNTNTSSNFRVDRIHHKVSLASMFGPSPDWVVGVNGLNLCNTDCSWKDSVDIDLYPWDAGTDNGISYMSPNAETQPRERMYRITTMYPEDPRQPFYNTQSTEMTPLARLYIRKEKQIPRACEAGFLESQVLDVSENDGEEITKPECFVTDFGEWTPCSVSCGKGIRMRSRFYINELIAIGAKCSTQLINREMCVADVPECDETTVDEDGSGDDLSISAANVDDDGEGLGVCRTTKWADWSPCSATCGIVISMRTRTFVEHAGRKKCPHITIVEKEKCMKPECTIVGMEMPDPECPVTQWSDWGPCSVSCGNGVRIRARQLLVDGAQAVECSKRMSLNEQNACSVRADCIFDAEAVKEICSMKPEVGLCRGTYQRFAFDAEFGGCLPFNYSGCRGNQNNFLTLEECRRTCQRNGEEHSQMAARSNLIQPPESDCRVTEWSEWSGCSVSCGVGISERSRRIISEAQNGGVPCPSKLVKRRRCYQGMC